MEESWSSGGAPLLRTRSLPLVLEASGAAPVRPAKLDPRQLLTLTRHYYPEGGWGWGVAAAATLAQMLAHGLHQAAAVLTVEVLRRFGPEVRMQAGEKDRRALITPYKRLLASLLEVKSSLSLLDIIRWIKRYKHYKILRKQRVHL